MRTSSSFSSIVSIACLCLTASGCEFHFGGNSSKGDNDYFEEPLSARVEKFGPALESSNKFVDRFRDNKIEEIYDDFTDSLREQMTLEETRGFRENSISETGEFLEFLPGQWAFQTGTEDDRDVLYSAKIVVHEKMETYYIFVFLDDGIYDKVHGFRLERRSGDGDGDGDGDGERILDVIDAALAGDT